MKNLPRSLLKYLSGFTVGQFLLFHLESLRMSVEGLMLARFGRRAVTPCMRRPTPYGRIQLSPGSVSGRGFSLRGCSFQQLPVTAVAISNSRV